MSEKYKKYNYDEVKESSLDYFGGDELTTSVWIGKYSLKDSQGNIYELNPSEMHNRLATEFSKIENKYNNPLSYDDIYGVLDKFKYIIPGGSSMSGVGNDLQITSISNCFVVGSESDSYGGICRTDEEQVQLMKRRGGVGHDLTHIRPKGTPVKNSALTSTGVVPFMERYSNSTREVAQDGRRGALMLSISAKSMDSEDFIDAKMTEGKITGANISIKLDNNFMKAVKNDGEYVQQYPVKSTSPIYTSTIKAKKFWDKIIHNAWKSAEPGIMFWDNIINESIPDCYPSHGFETVSTNPCFTGDTIVAVADGRNGVSIKQLAEENKRFTVYSARQDDSEEGKWITEVKEAIAFKTGTKTTIEITLSDGSSFRCTPEHQLALSNKDYICAKDSLGKELGKFYTCYNKTTKKSYRRINQNINTDNDPSSTLLNNKIYVVDIKEAAIEDVYDLTVDDNHNFYIITKTDDDKYLNCSGVLVHNCGEVPLCPYDSCRLMSINLFSYVVNPYTKESYFDFELFKNHVRIGMRLMDDIIDIELDKINNILKKIDEDPEDDNIKRVERELWQNVKTKALLGRRTGLGITAEGDMLAALGYIYGTDEGNDFAENVHKIFAVEAYKESIDLAEQRGPFTMWNLSNEFNNPFIQRIYNELDQEYKEKYRKFGRRNVAALSIAPTGSISILTQTTSGIEPVFLPVYKRRKKINPSDKYAKIDFVDEVGDKWEEYQVFHPKFKMWAEINGYNISELERLSTEEINEIVKLSPYYKATSNDVDWVKKVELQGRIQKWIDHSISVTVNLPNSATEEIVSAVYMKGWESGCKGITIYRDGSRSGVLVSNDAKKKTNNDFEIKHAPKRPKTLIGDYYVISAKGNKFGIVVGKWGNTNKPYEIFAFSNPTHLSNCSGTITKVKKGQYKFECENFVMDNLELAATNDLERSHTLMISMLLRHGAPIEHICNVAKKIDDNITSFSSSIRRVLNKYIDEKEVQFESCPECGGKLIKTDGCIKCENTLPGAEKICTYSKCG